MIPWWWWPYFCAPLALPAIFQGYAKVNGQEGGSNIIVGPSSTAGFPGTGGETGAGGGAGAGAGAGGEAGAAGAAPGGGGPGPGAPAGGEGGAGGGGGNSTISLTDLRGDCGVAGVGYAFVISAGSIQLGGSQAGGTNQTGRNATGGANGASTMGTMGNMTGGITGGGGAAMTAPSGMSDPPGTFRFTGGPDTFTVRPMRSQPTVTYTHAPNYRTVE